MKKIKIGNLDRRITLIRVGFSFDQSRGIGKKYTESEVVLDAYIKEDGGNEAVVKDQEVNKDRKSFIIRYRPDDYLDLTDEVRYNGKTYEITHVEEIGRRKWLKLECKFIE